MYFIVVGIVRGAWGWKGLGAKSVHQGVPGVLNFTAIYYTLAPLAYRGRSWAALGVCVAPQDVSGELPEALWRSFGTSWGALGALFGSIFGVKSSSLQFQIEKCTRSVFQLDEVYKACCFKPHLNRSW